MAGGLTLTSPSRITSVDPSGSTVGAYPSLSTSVDPGVQYSSFMDCGADPKNGLPGFYMTLEDPAYQDNGSSTFDAAGNTQVLNQLMGGGNGVELILSDGNPGTDSEELMDGTFSSTMSFSANYF